MELGDRADVRFVLHTAQSEFHRGDDAIPHGNADCSAPWVRDHRRVSGPFRDHAAVSPRTLVSRGHVPGGPHRHLGPHSSPFPPRDDGASGLGGPHHRLPAYTSYPPPPPQSHSAPP